ncbi:MAG: hypothetical protein D3926_18945 [Desulfobacteraceae bacterium]|nr:MAG: hypothetical protein D3926_18945 [Desulfobacteraceae bacterium]
MKQYVSILLFIGFVILCGAEIFPKFIALAKQRDNSVLYVKSAKEPALESKPESIDYKELIKGMNGKGA